MKTRIATLISIGGVLIAGTAAAVVNTQIFDDGETVAGESAALLAPEPTIVPLSVGSDGSGSTSTSVTNPTDGTEYRGQLTEFAVGDAGYVTVDVIGDRLRLVSVAPANGWSVVEQEEYPSGDHVEVTLASGSTAIEFEADLIDGVVVPELEASSHEAGSGSSSPGYRDDDHDDDDHDEYEDDDHDEYEYDDHDEYEDHDDD